VSTSLTCRVCGYLHDAAQEVTNGDAQPGPDDLSVCLNCGALSAFTSDGGLRPLRQEEYAELPQDAFHAQFFIRQRGLIKL
jgi:rubredoxin